LVARVVEFRRMKVVGLEREGAGQNAVIVVAQVHPDHGEIRPLVPHAGNVLANRSRRTARCPAACAAPPAVDYEGLLLAHLARHGGAALADDPEVGERGCQSV
jgi:hypothetical protein